MELFGYVGSRIRELRDTYGGDGVSQTKLGQEINVAANTISRWETATYRPTLEDLDKLARFFGVSILEFFPPEDAPKDERLLALLRTAGQLQANDLDELQRYAEFRRAQSLYSNRGRPKRGRTRKDRM